MIIKDDESMDNKNQTTDPIGTVDQTKQVVYAIFADGLRAAGVWADEIAVIAKNARVSGYIAWGAQLGVAAYKGDANEVIKTAASIAVGAAVTAGVVLLIPAWTVVGTIAGIAAGTGVSEYLDDIVSGDWFNDLLDEFGDDIIKNLLELGDIE
jgi:hypothetical protein